jgi:transcriptional regulator with XRE-family HTH domain
MPIDPQKLAKAIGDRPIARVAEAAGMQRPDLHRLLRGDRPDPRLSTVERLASALGVSIEDLLVRDLRINGQKISPVDFPAAARVPNNRA